MIELAIAFAAGAASCFAALYISAIRRRRRPRAARGENSKTRVGETVVAIVGGREVLAPTFFQRLTRRFQNAYS